jgi:hypothetical protein
MIDRKALWISSLLLIAMTAAGLWRLSLLQDWHHVPVGPPDEHHSVGGFFLFAEPAALLLVMLTPYLRKWTSRTSEESLQVWRRWSSRAILLAAPLLALGQAFLVTRSLGLFSEADGGPVAKAMMVLSGLMLVVIGNALPKMPWLSSRIRPLRLDPWQWNRQLRFVGKVTVAFGLFAALVCPFLPAPTLRPAILTLWLAAMAANIAYRIKVRREPSLLAGNPGESR